MSFADLFHRTSRRGRRAAGRVGSRRDVAWQAGYVDVKTSGDPRRSARYLALLLVASGVACGPSSGQGGEDGGPALAAGGGMAGSGGGRAPEGGTVSDAGGTPDAASPPSDASLDAGGTRVTVTAPEGGMGADAGPTEDAAASPPNDASLDATGVYDGPVTDAACPNLPPAGQWQNVSPPGSNYAQTYAGMLAIAVRPDNPAVVYIGADLNGIFKSTDCGATWAVAATGENGRNYQRGRALEPPHRPGGARRDVRSAGLRCPRCVEVDQRGRRLAADPAVECHASLRQSGSNHGCEHGTRRTTRTLSSSRTATAHRAAPARPRPRTQGRAGRSST